MGLGGLALGIRAALTKERRADQDRSFGVVGVLRVVGAAKLWRISDVIGPKE